MVSSDTLAKSIYTISIICALIFIIFVWKLPVFCVACEPNSGLWYRCISGGTGTKTCDIEEGLASYSTGGITKILKELLDFGIKELPKDILNIAVGLKNDLVKLGQTVMNGIKETISNVTQKLSSIFNDYIKAPIVNAYNWVKDEVVIPVIQGVVNYIINPIKSLIGSMIELKNAAIDAIKSALMDAKNLSVKIYDYTYGNLIAGFDNVPQGLVDFVVIIQTVLNGLKNGIIGGANDGVNSIIGFVNDASNFLMHGLKSAITGAEDVVNVLGNFADTLVYDIMNGAKTAVNAIVDGANWLIDQITYPFIYAINAALTYDFGKSLEADLNSLTSKISGTFAPILATISNPIISAINYFIGTIIAGSWNAIANIKIMGWKPFKFLGTMNWTNIEPVTKDTFKIPFIPIPSFKLDGDANFAYLTKAIPNVDFDAIHICGNPNQCVSFAETANAALPGDNPIDAKNVIPNPADLFWAGTRPARLNKNILSQSSTGVCSLICAKNGYQSSSVVNGSCLCSKFSLQTNLHIGVESCVDVCDNIGGIAVCATCPNEVVLTNDPSILYYTVSSPSNTYTSDVKFPIENYTTNSLLYRLAVLLANDININTYSLKTLTSWNINSNAFTFSYSNDVISLKFNGAFAAVSKAMITISFSTNSILATVFGFTTTSGTTVTLGDATFSTSTAATSTSTPNMVMQQYKGWMIYNYSSTNTYPCSSYYIYMNPKLFLLQPGSINLLGGGKISETDISQSQLNSYIDMGTYYNDSTGNNHYALTSQNVGYPITAATAPISLPANTPPIDSGYRTSKLASGLTIYSLNFKNYYVYDNLSMLYPMSLTNTISFGATPILAGYTQQKTSYGTVYYVKNGQNYVYDNLAGGGAGSFFPVDLNNVVFVDKSRNLSKPEYDDKGKQIPTSIVYYRTTIGEVYQQFNGGGKVPRSGVECYVIPHLGQVYIYDPASASSSTTKNNLYRVTLSRIPLLSTLAQIGMNVSNKYTPLTNVYSNSANSYYYYDGANTLYPLFGNAPLNVNVTSSSLATYTYNNNSGFIYYTDGNGNNYAYNGTSTLYLLSSLTPSATIYGDPLVNGYTESSSFGYVLNGDTYAFFQVPAPLSLIKFLTTSDCSAACGNNEMLSKSNPSSLTYGFVSENYNVHSSITFPLFPRDIYGNLLKAVSSVTFSYTPQTFLSTLIYLLCQDLNLQRPISGDSLVFTPSYFNFSYNSSTNKYTFALQNSLLPTLGLGVYTFYTSLNIIMASNMGVSSDNDVTISTTGSNIMSTTPYPSSTSLTSSNNILTYRLVDIINTFDYTSSITFPVGSYDPYGAIEYLLSFITRDINLNTNNAYNLGYTSISITYSNGMYTYILPILPSVTISLFFKRNTSIGTLFGMGTLTGCTDLVLFPCVNRTTFTSAQSIDICIMNYKGWNLYNTNGGHYVYMDPKLFLLSGGSTTCATLSCNETIVTSLAPYTQVNEGSTQYYILPNYSNNTSTPYFLTSQLSGYEVNTKDVISLDDTPLNLGYQSLTTNNGLNFYKNNVIRYYMVSSASTVIEVRTTPVSGVNLTHNSPDKLEYVFKQGTRTLTGLLDFPGRNYTSITFAEELSYMLSQDVSSQGVSLSVSDLNITFDQTATLMNFSATSTIPFQILLKFGGNTILSSNFGVTGDVLVVTTYPAQIGPQSAVSVNPYTLAYTFEDKNFKHKSFVTFPSPFTYNTPTDIASKLATLLAADINSRTSYNYVAASFIFSYNATTRKFTMSVDPSPSFPSGKFYQPKIVLQFTKDNKIPINNTILPSTWGQAFGFISDTTITNTPIISTLTSTINSPMKLSYLCTDSANIVNITSHITFNDTFASDGTLDAYITELTTLLSADIMSKQSAYQITPSSFAISYSGPDRVLSFGFGPSIPLTLTLQFSLSSLIASNFGCSADITFASSLPFIAPNAAIQTFAAHQGIEVYTINGKQCAYISGLRNFYEFVPGDSNCSFGQCKESLPLSASEFDAYIDIGGALKKTGDTFIYNASYSTLYPITRLTTPSVTLYGPYSDNGYTQMSICNLDENGNCVSVDPTAVPMAYEDGNKDKLYAFVTTQKTLIQFATNSVNVTQCPCEVKSKIAPTCDQVCSLENSSVANGGPLKCQNPKVNGGSNPAVCQCYETGPVNVIIEPMQKYNPFRLIKSGVSAGFNELSKGISYAVKNFLVPIWNTIRLVISFASSIIVMVLQFIIQYGNPVYWFEQIKIAITSGLGDNAIIAKAKEFINNTVLPGLKSIWDYRLVIFNGISSVASKVWSAVMGVLSKISKGIASVVGTLFTYIWEGIKYGWNFASWFVGSTVETLTPFIPIPPFVKFTIIMILLILGIGAIIGLDEIALFLIDIIITLYEILVTLVSRVYAVTQDIIFGTASD